MNINLFRQAYFKIFIIIILLTAASFVLMYWFSPLKAFQVAWGSFVVLFLPGFFFSFIFFPKSQAFNQSLIPPSRKSLDGASRVIFSVFFSFSMVSLVLTFLRRINIMLSPLIVTLVILGINIACFSGALIVWQRQRKNK